MHNIARLLLVASFGALAVPPARAEPLTIHIAFSQAGVGDRQFAGLQTTAIAHARGYVADEFKNDPDIHVQWIFFRAAGPATNEAISAGQVDFFSQGDLPSIIGRAAGLKTHLLLNVAARQTRYVAVPPTSPIKTLEDLRGKRVAQHMGTNLSLSVSRILAAHGLADRDIRFINMDDDTSAAAVAGGQVDAAFGTQPLLELQRKGLARIIYSTKTDSPVYTSNSAFFVTEAFETAHPDLVARVVKAVTRAAAWASDEANRQAVFDTWGLTGIPAENYAAEFEGQSLKYRNSPLIDAFFVARYREQAEATLKFGYIRHSVTVDDWFEPKYLDAAIKELHFEHVWDHYDAEGRVVPPAG